jgi:solute carrier family 35 protein E3
MDKLPFRYPTWALIVGSILTTVVLVMVNKLVFAGGFPYVLALSTMHFIATYGLMVLMARGFGMFEVKFLPATTNFVVGSVGVASICFSNYSLQFNSVGTYQMAKLCVIPVVLGFNALRGEFASRKVHAALVVILTGVGAATVTDVQLNAKGLGFACGAVVATAQYQIWQGSKQKEGGLNEMHMSMSVSFVQMLVAGLLSSVVEFRDMHQNLVVAPREDINVPDLTMKILASCLLAVSANVHSFALIGRTNAVTFQVVGHGKTCLILIAGYIMFPLPSMLDLLYNVTGVSLAVFGVVVYSNLKLNEPVGTKDWVRRAAAAAVAVCTLRD